VKFELAILWWCYNVEELVTSLVVFDRAGDGQVFVGVNGSLSSPLDGLSLTAPPSASWCL
jgi:hypothetical protein